MNTTTTTTTAIHITAGGDVTVVDIRGGSECVTDLQAKVGGYVEFVSLTPSIALVCDEEGKLKGRPTNHVANRIVAHLGAPLIPGDYIVGDVLLVGDNDGEVVSIERGIATLIANL